MSPKEKAEELVNYFMELKHVKLADYSRIEWPTAKKCALKVVDEILKAFELADVTSMDGSWGKWEWNEVKQEIENL